MTMETEMSTSNSRTALAASTFSLQSPNSIKWNIYRNLMVVSFTYAFVLTGVTCISNVQSSLNSEQGLGTISLGVQTATMIIQALFFNAIAISRLGLKWCMSLGIILEAVYIAGNIYPTWVTLIPAAAISGFGRPLIKTAIAIYIIKIAINYAKILDLADGRSIKTKFFYIYYIVYCSSRVFGSVASSLILGSGLKNFDLSLLSSSDKNATHFDAVTSSCGAKFCNEAFPNFNHLNESSPDVKQTTSNKADATKIYWLCAFSVGCMVIAFIINVAFLQSPHTSDSIEDDRTVVDPEEEVVINPIHYLFNTIRSWKSIKQLLMIPLLTYNGIDNAFISTDFPSAFVTCYFGVQWVGFVIAWYGLTSPIAVFVASFFNKTRFRPYTFMLAFFTHLGVCITLLTWTPTISALPKLFILSATWGIGSGLWPTILSAFLSVIFEKDLEAAFSNMWLFDSIGALLTYAWGNALCTYVKIAIYTTFLTTGILGYLTIEIWISLKKKQIIHIQK